MTKRTFQIYRYDPDKDAKPYMQTIEIELDGHERMLLDALMKLKARTPRCRSAAHAAKASVAPTR
jgi:succinate dehydrogenase / fumarate reductase iron-sulfur subunit